MDIFTLKNMIEMQKEILHKLENEYEYLMENTKEGKSLDEPYHAEIEHIINNSYSEKYWSKIDTIKYLRKLHPKLSLYEAKTICDRYYRANNIR